MTTGRSWVTPMRGDFVRRTNGTAKGVVMGYDSVGYLRVDVGGWSPCSWWPYEVEHAPAERTPRWADAFMRRRSQQVES